VLDKIHRFTDGYGQQLTGIGVDTLPRDWQRKQLAWVASDIVPRAAPQLPGLAVGFTVR
jgi:hypothetical protein